MIRDPGLESSIFLNIRTTWLKWYLRLSLIFQSWSTISTSFRSQSTMTVSLTLATYRMKFLRASLTLNKASLKQWGISGPCKKAVWAKSSSSMPTLSTWKTTLISSTRLSLRWWTNHSIFWSCRCSSLKNSTSFNSKKHRLTWTRSSRPQWSSSQSAKVCLSKTWRFRAATSMTIFRDSNIRR